MLIPICQGPEGVLWDPLMQNMEGYILKCVDVQGQLINKELN